MSAATIDESALIIALHRRMGGALDQLSSAAVSGPLTPGHALVVAAELHALIAVTEIVATALITAARR